MREIPDAVEDVQRRVTSFAGEMREKGIHVGINGRCVCGTPWPCNGSATDPTTTPAQPATPGQALRWAADRWRRDAFGINEWPTEAMLRHWAAELDDPPAAYRLPQEPRDGTRLRDRGGGIWERDGRYVAPWTLVVTFRGEAPSSPVRWHWPELLAVKAPLSTAPPAGTEADDG